MNLRLVGGIISRTGRSLTSAELDSIRRLDHEFEPREIEIRVHYRV